MTCAVVLTEGPSYEDPNHLVCYWPSDDYKDANDLLKVPANDVFDGKAELEFTENGDKVVEQLKEFTSFVYWAFASNPRSGSIANDRFYHAFYFTDDTEANLFHKKFGGEILLDKGCS